MRECFECKKLRDRSMVEWTVNGWVCHPCLHLRHTKTVEWSVKCYNDNHMPINPLSAASRGMSLAVKELEANNGK